MDAVLSTRSIKTACTNWKFTEFKQVIFRKVMVSLQSQQKILRSSILLKCQFRNMLGESLGSLTMRDLKNLESKVERGISKIRSKKVPSFVHSRFFCVLYVLNCYIFSSYLKIDQPFLLPSKL